MSSACNQKSNSVERLHTEVQTSPNVFRNGKVAARLSRHIAHRRAPRPGDLPIDQASKFTLALNLKTAKQLGINVPPNLLTLVDEVIE